MIFRRDLRLQDNAALIKAAQNSKEVLPIFIFDTKQYSKENNSFFSQNAFEFMITSLNELQETIRIDQGRLLVCEGEPTQVVDRLLSSHGIDAVFVNEDVTPFSKQRDEDIKTICHSRDCAFVSCHDLFLTRPGSVRTQNNDMYQVFTPFMRKAQEQQVPKPTPKPTISWYVAKDEVFDYSSLVSEYNTNKIVSGGRSEALKLLDGLKDLKEYAQKRNIPSIRGTSRLSAHHKFGTISVRETYYRIRELFGVNHKLISELYWRDFYSHLVAAYPELLTKKVEFQKKYRGITWQEDQEAFDAWKNGLTGYPIVDAGMRELNTTGYMHNRVRMIVASFLTKHLRLDWRLGEKYFASKLTDYDPAVNNGSWQWAASTGCDAQPYFRIFNPWSQQKRYDKDCLYIKKWVPELSDIDAKHIHKIADNPVKDYPEPIVDHSHAREETLAWFKSLQ